MSVIDQIATAIGADRILTGKDAAPSGKDWTGAYTSTPLAVLRPMSTAEVAAIIAAHRAGDDGASGGRVGSVKLVVDGARLSARGSQGGYFYALYLNMPPVIDSDGTYNKCFLGTLGAFEIAAASHHGPAKLEFDLVGLLLQQKVADVSNLSLSWVRVDGDNPPAGQTINVAEARIDLSYEAASLLPPAPGLPGRYR